MTKHLESKLSSAKTAINATWLEYIRNPKISLSNKLKIFITAAKSILFYGAQVWGFVRYEQVEKLFRFFIKKILYLPSNTPNYMLHIETGLPCLYIDTLRLHFNYINKILAMTDNSLPKILAKETIVKDIYWASKLKSTCSEFDIVFDLSETSCISNELQVMITDNIIEKDFENHKNTAKRFQFHDAYTNLSYMFPEYFSDLNSQYMMSLIFKARGGLLILNARAFHSNSVSICTICNRNELENTFHFIAVCPIFSYERTLRFGKPILTISEFYGILNGENFLNLYYFLKNSTNYRNLIINEFN